MGTLLKSREGSDDEIQFIQVMFVLCQSQFPEAFSHSAHRRVLNPAKQNICRKKSPTPSSGRVLTTMWVDGKRLDQSQEADVPRPRRRRRPKTPQIGIPKFETGLASSLPTGPISLSTQRKIPKYFFKHVDLCSVVFKGQKSRFSAHLHSFRVFPCPAEVVLCITL